MWFVPLKSVITYITVHIFHIKLNCKVVEISQITLRNSTPLCSAEGQEMHVTHIYIQRFPFYVIAPNN